MNKGGKTPHSGQRGVAKKMEYYDMVMEAVRFIESRTSRRPGIAIILGSGLGGLVDRMEETETIPYADIPGFPRSSVAGHAARLVFGRLNGQEIVGMQGRFHFYEGFTMKQVTFPVFVLHQLGVKSIVLTNASGGINKSFSPGDLMLITDHLNLFGLNVLIGPNDERFGPRFPDMTEVYSRQLIRQAKQVARKLDIDLKEGVYAFLSGPSYETAAEIHALSVLGADAVGMSTVPEAIVARYLGMKTLGISCITNLATGISLTEHSHEAVLNAANAAGENMCRLVENLLGLIGSDPEGKP